MNFKTIILITCLFSGYLLSAQPTIVINEIMADNETVLADGEGEYKDWIELHNTGNTSINLQGWYLTDNSDDLTKWTFPAATIAANGYLIVWASGKYPTSLNNGLHTNFSLESKGEYLALVMPDGITVAHELSYTALPEDVSYGIFSGSDGDYTNSGNFVPLATPTPFLANSNALEAPVTFSVDGRFFNDFISVELSTSVPGGTIYYTTDGSVPNVSSPIYNAPLTISSTTQLNVIVPYAGGGISPVKTERYVEMTNTVANFSSDLPIILIQTYNNDLDTAFQTKTFASIIEPDATGRASGSDPPVYSGPMGVKIRGSSSAFFPKKQFKVETWNENNEEINVEILGMPAESDWVLYAPGGRDHALINNAFMYELSRKMGFYAPRIRFVEVYINEGNNFTASDYRGVYIWMESIKRDNDRVDIKKLEPSDNNAPELTGGYMISIDRPGDWKTNGNFPSIPFLNTGFNHVEPKADELTTTQQNYIRNYMQDFENTLYSGNWLDPNTGYKSYIDLDSWTWEHMMRILAKDPDGLRLSSYYYKDRDEPIKAGPIWDFDRTLNSGDWRDDDPNEWFYDESNDRVDYFEYGWWSRMTEDPDWRVEWHDNWFEQRRDKYLNINVVHNLIDSLAAIIQEAQARDEARWVGNGNYGYRYGGFSGEIQALKNWIASRMNWIDDQLIPSPEFFPKEAVVSPGSAVTLVNPYGSGAIYYTIDGSDPRLPGGGLAPNAYLYNSPIPVNFTKVIAARIFVNGNWGNQLQSPWGAICTQRYKLPQDYSNIVINEIMYHPDTVCGALIPELDYIEITNKGGLNIDMSFAQFTDGVQFTFPFGSYLGPNQFYVIAENKAVFEANYNVIADGTYKGTLSDKGDSLVLKDFQSNIIDLVDFNDKNPWDEDPDGKGPSLELLNPLADNIDPLNWFRSDNPCGTPGAENSRICTNTAEQIVINEINYNSDNGAFDPGDWVELQNPGTDTVDISGWTFYDNNNDYILPVGTVIEPEGFLVLVEDEAVFAPLFPHLNSTQYLGNFSFGLSNKGERVSLFDDNKCLSDYVVYNDKLPWDTIPDGNGPTLSLITPNSDNALAQAWESSSNINSAYGTPGRPNTPCLVQEIIAPDTLCAEEAVLLTLDILPDNTTYNWFIIGADTPVATTDSVTTSWTNPGTYNIQLVSNYFECTKIYNRQIIVEACNAAPALAGDFYSIAEDDILDNGASLLSNDAPDPEGDNVLVSTQPAVQPANGTVSLNPDGTFIYTPNPDFNGSDGFEYEVCDDGSPVACNTAVVEIVVTPVNDAPLAVADYGSTDEDASYTGNLLTNDSEPDGDGLVLNTNVISPPANGSVFIIGSGFFAYTPDADFNGTDSLQYEICDDGNPALCSVGTVYITVEPANDAPVAVADIFSVNTDGILTTNVLSNDTDIDGDSLIANTVVVSSPANGTVSIQANGDISYQPDPGYTGTDSFDYEACDPSGLCSTASVQIEVTQGCVDIQLYAFLEGAYDSNTGEMNAAQNTLHGLLPGQTPSNNLVTPTPPGQPYNIAPWNYTGTEGAAWTDANYTDDMVDWLLVSFRTEVDASTEIAQAAAVLNKDGSLYFPTCALLNNGLDSVYVLIEHRNHVGIMSPQKVPVLSGILSYDFRNTDSYKDATSFGQKEILPGTWAMFAGDADQSDFPSYDITGTDKTIWLNDNGIFQQYIIPDFNLDGDVNGADKALWDSNNGVSSRVPK